MRIGTIFASLGMLAVAALVYGFTVGIFPHFYALEWDEDVQLSDGRVIGVHMRHTYERLHTGFSRYADAITRDTEMTFDSGPPAGRVTQLFKGYHPLFLGKYEGVWYVTLYGSSYGHSNEMPGQDWERFPEGCPPAAKLVGNHFEPIRLEDLPAVFKKPNVLMLNGESSEHPQFNGRHLSVYDKAAWLDEHPRGPSTTTICRPRPRASASAHAEPVQSKE